MNSSKEVKNSSKKRSPNLERRRRNQKYVTLPVLDSDSFYEKDRVLTEQISKSKKRIEAYNRQKSSQEKKSSKSKELGLIVVNTPSVAADFNLSRVKLLPPPAASSQEKRKQITRIYSSVINPAKSPTKLNHGSKNKKKRIGSSRGMINKSRDRSLDKIAEKYDKKLK